MIIRPRSAARCSFTIAVLCSAAVTRTAYTLASIAVIFRVTQIVDIVRGVHAMIAKSLLTGELRRRIAVV